MPIVKVGDQRIKFPDSMSQEDIGAVLQTNFGQPQASTETPQETAVEASPTVARRTRHQRRADDRLQRAEADNVSIFEGLPPETIDRIMQETDKPEHSGRGPKADFQGRKQMATLEKLRMVNPSLAEEIESMSTGESMAIGAGGAVQNMYDGLHRLFTQGDAEQYKKPHLDALKNIRSSAELGDALGQAGMMALPGGAANAVVKGGLGKAAAAGAISGGAEGGLISAGRGDDSTQIKANTAIGVLTGGAAPVAIRGIGDAITSKSKTALDAWKSKKNIQADAPQEAVGPTILETSRSGPAPRSPEMQAIKDKIANGIADKDTAGFKINNKGVMVRDGFEKDALKHGWSDGITPVIKSSTGIDRLKMRKMVDIYDRGTKNLLDKAKTRPAQIVGNSIMERYKTVKSLNSQAASRIDEVANTLKGKRVDFDPAVTNFKTRLEAQGVSVRDNWTLDFSDSAMEFSPASQKFLNNMIMKMSRGEGGVDAHRGHVVKKMIDTMVDYGKRNQNSADSITEGIVKSLRHDIDEVLDSKFPQYDKVNTTFRNTKEALDEFAKQAGSKFRPEQANVEDFTGVLARTFMSNNRGRPALITALDNLEGVATANGKKFKDNVLNQVVFIEEMERILGPSATTSLFGDVDKAIQRGAETITGSATGAAIDATKGVVKKIQGKTPENALKFMRKYLASFEDKAA